MRFQVPRCILLLLVCIKFQTKFLNAQSDVDNANVRAFLYKELEEEDERIGKEFLGFTTQIVETQYICIWN